MKMGPISWVAFILVVIGGLNWGLVGFFGFNLVDTIFGVGSILSRIVYDLVGLGALVMIIRPLAKKSGTSEIPQA